jgi:hypothetical protein
MDTTAITILALIIIGSIASLVLLVRAFQVGPWWGVLSLLVCGVQTIFGLVHFSRAKYSFLIMHLSFAALVVLVVQKNIPLTEEGLMSALGGSTLALTDPKELTTRIQEKRDGIEKLEGEFHKLGSELAVQFAALNARRTSLKAGDTAAIEQFNVEAAAYDTKNKAHKSVAAEIESARKELQELLDERSRRGPEGSNNR